MSRTAFIITCVVIFLAVMIGLNQLLRSLTTDMLEGLAIGVVATLFSMIVLHKAGIRVI